MANTAEEARKKSEVEARRWRGATLYHWLGLLADEMKRGKTPQGWLDPWLDRFIDFLEHAVDNAYCNGWNDAVHDTAGKDGARRPGEIRSALKNGKLRPVRPDKRGRA